MYYLSSLCLARANLNSDVSNRYKSCFICYYFYQPRSLWCMLPNNSWQGCSMESYGVIVPLWISPLFLTRDRSSTVSAERSRSRSRVSDRPWCGLGQGSLPASLIRHHPSSSLGVVGGTSPTPCHHPCLPIENRKGC